MKKKKSYGKRAAALAAALLLLIPMFVLSASAWTFPDDAKPQFDELSVTANTSTALWGRDYIDGALEDKRNEMVLPGDVQAFKHRPLTVAFPDIEFEGTGYARFAYNFVVYDDYSHYVVAVERKQETVAGEDLTVYYPSMCFYVSQTGISYHFNYLSSYLVTLRNEDPELYKKAVSAPPVIVSEYFYADEYDGDKRIVCNVSVTLADASTHDVTLLLPNIGFWQEVKSTGANLKATMFSGFDEEGEMEQVLREYSASALKDVSFDVGYKDGYNQGVHDTQSNFGMFVDGFTKMFDVPLKAVHDLLNFEILGINIYFLATSLITISLVIWVLKKVGVF